MSYLVALLETVLFAVAALQSSAQELQAYALDVDDSRLHVVVHRAGLLSFLGHEHAIVPERWSAELCLGSPIPAGAHASLSLETGSLVIDADSARALAGLGDGPDDETRRELQAKMLDAEHLDAATFPEIRLELRAAERADDERVRVEGTIMIHGVTRDVSFPVRVEQAERRTLLIGTLRIRQRDFGIEPESKAGLVKVSNDVDLQFALLASPTGQRCSGA